METNQMREKSEAETLEIEKLKERLKNALT
jgi:hypothetical protein